MGCLDQSVGKKRSRKIFVIRVQFGRIRGKSLSDALLDLIGLETTDDSVPNHRTRAVGTEIGSGGEVHDYRLFVDNLAHNIFVAHSIEWHPSPPTPAQQSNCFHSKWAFIN